MKHVNFFPWIGENYFSKGFRGKRLLVLGESHHCSCLSEEKCPSCSKDYMKSECHSFTEDVINDYVYHYSGQPYEQTFLCFERALYGKELSQQEREDLWNSIIFYNYIQFAQEAPRMPIKPEYWEESGLAFKEILEEYMPDYIIVWGVRLYKGLPDLNGIGSKLVLNDNKSIDIWTYTINGKHIPAIKVHHPSSPTGKSWLYWHNVYNKFWDNY